MRLFSLADEEGGAVAVMASDAAIDQCKIITVTGPKEGVGKSILALNLAYVRAAQTGRGVVLLAADPLCREELLHWMGMTQFGTISSLKDLVDFYARAGAGQRAVDLVRGKIAFSKAGVAVVPLGFQLKDVTGAFDPKLLHDFLKGLVHHYDIIVDTECAYALLTFFLEISDGVYWVTIPQRPAIAATIGLFEDLRSEHFGLDRVEIVVNQYNLPGAMPVGEIERYFSPYNKKIKFRLPWEEEIPEAANSGNYLIVNNSASEWGKILRFIANHIKEVKPKSSARSVVDLARHIEEAGSFWKLRGGAANGAGPLAGGEVPAGSLTSRPDAEGAADLEWETNADPRWNKMKEEIHAQVVSEMAMVKVANETQRQQKVTQIITHMLDRRHDVEMNREEREKFITELLDEILGLGPLQVLLRDPTITEIMVNSCDKIYIERKGKLLLTPLRFRTDDQLVEVIRKIVAPLGRRVDESSPLVDARLKDGSRVNGVIPPLAISGPTLTIRRFSAKPLGTEELIQMSSITAEMVEFIRACVLTAKNVVISGGTGTGKTTFLNFCSSYIPMGERIVTIEDVAELKLQQPHWVRLESRPPNIEGKGEVTIRDLVRNALRMRPDRIVVGECRGGEAIDMLQAMNTGHDGSMTTIHANGPADALNRVKTMCLMSGMELPVWALHDMMSSAIHIICQLSRMEDGSRKVTSISEVTGHDEHGVKIQEIFKFVQTGIDAEKRVLGYHAATGVIPNAFKAFATHGLEMSDKIFKPKEQK
ncbi:MAG: Flp pilus assembly complex ATPase component TadA [Elusimicrobia bacterium]|nr:Flp pilus assembly complex ATPase component TadA [Elusimicrobiota bacterium]